MVFYCHINSVNNALADRFDELSLKSGRRHSSHSSLQPYKNVGHSAGYYVTDELAVNQT